MSTVLIDQCDNENIYKIKNVITSGECKTKLEEHMQNKWDPNKLNKLFLMVSMGLTKFYDTKSGIDKVIKVLCLGKVQSGKTAFFISTMAMAMDNGYNLFYVIGGTKNNLLSQNRNRIQSEFTNNENIFIMDINGADTDDIRHKLQRGYKVVLMVLKNKNKTTSTNLSELERITKELNDFPSIIIDDEGDEYSQAKEQGDNPNSTKKVPPKAIHNALKNCIENMKKGVYLSVTATPQSNLLVSTLNALSPDECIMVEPGEGYTGASVFHDTLENQFVEEANDNSDFETCIPDTFKEALRFFILGCAVKRFRNDLEPHSMLVHPSAFINVHENIADKIKTELNLIKKTVQNPNGFAYDTIKEKFKSTFEKFKDELIGDFKFDDIWKFVDRNLDFTKIFVINGKELDDPKKTEDLKQDEKTYKYRIYIGGAMLERGITLENLAVTYIYRQAKKDNVDTLFQRARWFGYKEKYIDLCKVYMPKDLAEKFIELNNHEVYLWNTIKRFLNTGQPMQKMERLFHLDNKKLRLTRTSISKTIGAYSKCSGYIYDKTIDFSEENRLSNLKLYKDFIAKYGDSFIDKLEGNHINSYATFNYSDFYNEFISNYKFPGSTTKLKMRTFDDLKELVDIGLMDDECQVINMKLGEDISRPLADGGKFIKELPQGYNKSSKSVYPGDRRVGNNKFSIQLHYIYTEEVNVKYLLLAINNPHDEVAIKCVTGDNYYESE